MGKIQVRVGLPPEGELVQEFRISERTTLAELIMQIREAWYYSREQYHLDLYKIQGINRLPNEIFKYRLVCKGTVIADEEDPFAILLHPSQDCKAYIYLAPSPKGTGQLPFLF